MKKRRFLAILLTLAMAFSMMPITTFAAVADTDVAKIGDTGYAKLSDAIGALNSSAKSGEIILLKDCSESGCTINGNPNGIAVTLDLNGHTFTSSSGDAFTVSSGNTFTLSDSVGGGKVIARNGKGILFVKGSASITGGTYVTNANGGFVYIDKSRGGELSITGGTFDVNPASYDYFYDGNCSCVADGYEAVANGTTPETWTVKAKQDDVAYVAMIGEQGYETLDAAIAAAEANQTVEIVKAGSYTPTGIPKNITIKGVDGVVFDYSDKSGPLCSIPNGCTFENITFKFKGSNYTGFQHAGTINMNGCKLNGLLFSYSDMNFTDCTFDNMGHDYIMWLYAGDTKFDKCTFIAQNGRFFNVYNEGNKGYGEGPWKVAAENCTAINQKGTAAKAVFNVKETCGGINLTYDVSLGGTNVAVGAFPTAKEDGALKVLNGFVQVDDRREGGTDEGGNITIKSENDAKLAVLTADEYSEIKDNPTEIAKKAAVMNVSYETPGKQSYVAKIGDTGYEKFSDAVSAAKAATTTEGKTITIVGTVDEAYAFAGDCSGITFLGSETGKVTKGWTVQGSQTNMSNITIDGVKFVDGGNIVFSTAAANYSGMKIQNCTFIGTGAASTPAIQFGTGTAPFDGIKIYNNTISGFNGTSSSAIIFNNDNGNTNSGTVTIEKNTVMDFGHNGVQFILAKADLVIKDNVFTCTKTDKDVLNLNSAKSVTLTGNTFTVPADYSTGNQIVWNNNAGQIVDATGNTFIKGENTLTDIKDLAAHIAGYANNKTFVGYGLAKDANSKLNAGYLCSYNEATEFPIDLIAEGYEPVFVETYGGVKVYQIQKKTAEPVAQVTDKDGEPVGENDGKYETLAAAIAAVPADGTITMIGNDKLTANITSSKSFTLDLNGKTIDGDGKYGFELSGTAVIIKDSSGNNSGTITNCYSNGTEKGGAITFGGTTLDVYGGTFSNNKGAGFNANGGAIYVGHGTLTVHDGVFTGNTTTNGGAISVSGGAVIVDGGLFEKNTATGGGGALSTGSSATITMNGGTLDNNTANKGGGVYLGSTSEFILNDGTISNNKATGMHGGGVFVEVGSMTMNGGLIIGNSTSNYGGGIMSANNDLTITGGTITGNTANAFTAVASWGHYYNEGTLHISQAKGKTTLIDGSVWIYEADAGDEEYVSITGGRFTDSFEIGTGDAKFISGGIFTDAAKESIKEKYLAEGYKFVENTDEATKADYPWMIAENKVAAIGDTKYATLQAAFDAAIAGDTVKLLSNVYVTEQLLVEDGKNFNLDLAGFTIEYKGKTTLASGVIGIKHGGALTIKDSSTGKTGAIKSGDKAYAAVAMTIKDDTDDTKPAVLTVKGGTLEGYYYGITGNGSTGRGNTKVFIQGGTVKGTTTNDSTGIYNPQSGTLVISGGTVEGANGVYVKAGNPVTVSGGTIKGNGPKAGFVHSGNGVNNTGDAFIVENCGYPGGAPVPTITGGTFISENNQPVASYASGNTGLAPNEPVVGFVFGGQFKGAVNNDNSLSYNTTWSVEDENGYYTVGTIITHTHNFGVWTSDNESTHSRICDCGETEVGAHEFGAPTVSWTFPANGDVTATYSTTCNVCGKQIIKYATALKIEESDTEVVWSATATIGGKPYTATKKVAKTYTVTVTEGFTGGGDYAYGATVTVAPASTGVSYDFGLNGAPAAFNATSLTFKVTGNMTVTATEYVKPKEVKPVLTMTVDGNTTISKGTDGKYKVPFKISWAIEKNSGIEVVEVGYIYRYGGKDGATIDTATVLEKGSVKTSTLKSLNGSYKCTHGFSSSYAGRNIYAVGYMIYKKGGQTYTIYTDEIGTNEAECCAYLNN